MTKYDRFLIMGILLFALIWLAVSHCLWQGQEPVSAVVSLNGIIIQRVDLQSLTAAKRFSITGPLGTSIVEVKKGAARIVSAPCPDKICVKTGWISQPGQSAVCIPNRIILKIDSDDLNVDSIAR